MTAKEELLQRVARLSEAEADETLRLLDLDRGVEVPAMMREALEHELGAEPNEQPPVTCIGMLESGRGDLSERASRDEFVPRPFR